MELANIALAIGGDTGSTIYKYGVTPSEVAVLRLIHGDDSVTDINVIGDEPRTNRAERERLIEVYGRNESDGRRVAPAVDNLFPGVAARLYAEFAELELPEDLFRAERAPRAAKSEATIDAAPKKTGKKAKAADPVEPEEDPDDTAQDMPDAGIFAEQ